MTNTSTLEVARRIGDDLIALRRKVHQVPELGLDLPITQQVVLDALEGLDLEITTGTGLSSVTAVLRGRAEKEGEREVVLLRGDMDGLPVTEATGLAFSSTHTGRMHACGHDLHVAGLVGAARILHELRDELAGDVVFMFQPGEEGPGGAEIMIEEGLLDAAGRRADAAYALHVFAVGYPVGTWFARPGPQMAAAEEVIVRVIGRGGHGAQPFAALDPIPAACEMVLGLQTMVTRRFDVFDPVVVTVGKFVGGTKDNIIPDDAQFEATVRTFSVEVRERAHTEIERLVRGIGEAHGLRVEVEFLDGYPVTVNDEAEFAFAKETIVGLFGAERWADMKKPETGAEDMSFVLNEVPGAYLNISAAVGDDFENLPDNHSPHARFDESVVPDTAALLAQLALRRLSR